MARVKIFSNDQIKFYNSKRRFKTALALHVLKPVAHESTTTNATDGTFHRSISGDDVQLIAATSFHAFLSLPLSVRLQIWTFAASNPRTVSVLEPQWLEFRYNERGKNWAGISRTRMPAILATTQESRRIGLTIYQDLALFMQYESGPSSDRCQVPIYFNPEVDMLLRCKDACRTGGAFVTFFRGLGASAPLQGMRTLAVDATVVLPLPIYWMIFPRPPGNGGAFRAWENRKKEEPESLPRDLSKIVVEIADCAIKGVHEIIIVVNNDDNLSEITLVPYTTPLELRSKRESLVMHETGRLIAEVASYWALQVGASDQQYIDTSPPKISIMTPKRKPLKSFTLFPLLPPELQDLICTTAYSMPHLRFLTTTERKNRRVDIPRTPALAHASRATRRTYVPRTIFPGLPSTRGLSPRAEAPLPPLNAIDTVHLNIAYTWYRDYRKLNLSSLGLTCDEGYPFSGEDVRDFPALREIVVLQGWPHARCVMESVAVEEGGVDDVFGMYPGGDPWWETRLLAARLVVGFAGMVRRRDRGERVSLQQYDDEDEDVEHGAEERKFWKTWTPPVVRLAKMRAINETESPYSY